MKSLYCILVTILMSLQGVGVFHMHIGYNELLGLLKIYKLLQLMQQSSRLKIVPQSVQLSCMPRLISRYR